MLPTLIWAVFRILYFPDLGDLPADNAPCSPYRFTLSGPEDRQVPYMQAKE